MKGLNYILLPAVFLCQIALGIGYVVNEAHKEAFEIAYVIIPITGYMLVAYRLSIFRNVPRVSRAIVAVGSSGIVWYAGGFVVALVVMRQGLVQPR